MTESSAVATMPMFPLGMVLLPTMVVPVHVFEPRYRQMTKDCLNGGREFGVVLIERGSEVGGGDTRTHVGTAAQIMDSQEYPDGRWGLVVGGIRRIQVNRWLEDDPYPRAEIQDWPDTGHVNDEEIASQLPAVMALWRRVLALQSELGAPGPPSNFEPSEDLSTAVWQLSSSPFSDGAVRPTAATDRRQCRSPPVHVG